MRNQGSTIAAGILLLIILVILIAFGLRKGRRGGTQPQTVPFECQGEEGETLACTAEEEGVTVTVPWQGKKVQVEKLLSKNLDELLSEEDEFLPTRLVINFEVVEAETRKPVDEFSPPMELQVAYTADDYSSADGKSVLGFRRDGPGRWVALTKKKHDFRLEGGPTGGYGFATVSDWDDVFIAWGH